MLAMGEYLLWPRVLVRCCTPPSDVCVRMLNVQHGCCMLHFVAVTYCCARMLAGPLTSFFCSC